MTSTDVGTLTILALLILLVVALFVGHCRQERTTQRRSK